MRLNIGQTSCSIGPAQEAANAWRSRPPQHQRGSSRQSSGDLGPNRIVERPKVLYNASTASYVMYLHIDSPSYGDAKSPAGSRHGNTGALPGAGSGHFLRVLRVLRGRFHG